MSLRRTSPESSNEPWIVGWIELPPIPSIPGTYSQHVCMGWGGLLSICIQTDTAPPIPPFRASPERGSSPTAVFHFNNNKILIIRSQCSITLGGVLNRGPLTINNICRGVESIYWHWLCLIRKQPHTVSGVYTTVPVALSLWMHLLWMGYIKHRHGPFPASLLFLPLSTIRLVLFFFFLFISWKLKI